MTLKFMDAIVVNNYDRLHPEYDLRKHLGIPGALPHLHKIRIFEICMQGLRFFFFFFLILENYDVILNYTRFKNIGKNENMSVCICEYTSVFQPP